MDFVPDYKIAREKALSTGFSEYSSAYIIANEDLRQTMRFMPEKCENALVVAGSGDHPLFCSLYGAKHVDTFDISYNAKCIMDIKVAALQILSQSEVWQLLCDLYIAKDITLVKNMDKILAVLPLVQRDYIRAMKNYNIFNQRLNPRKYAQYFVNNQEYAKLRQIVKSPYNFMLSDVADLGANLTQNYDFIHLSNIFDNISSEKQFDVVSSLVKNVNLGGRILIQDQMFGKSDAACQGIENVYNNWRFAKLRNGINVLGRVK